tara:strand:+ start:1185 stop:2051 length:867 start_codon:yes stop_codon:yes gene_type:complete
MANVNEQENNEPRPNLYNQRKSWHTPDVMPTDNPVTADSLFVEPTQITQDESNVNREVPQEATEEKSSGNYKKRYDDLKKHYDSRLSQFKKREQELIQEATANRPEYKAPKTAEELEQFKSEYPDVYEVVETVAHLQSENKVADLQQRLDAMQSREAEILKREAEKDLVAKHPDFSDIRESDEFHSWAESQPEEIKDWIYNNPDNASLASKAIDLFKFENGFQDSSKETKPTSSRNDAAEMVSTKATTVQTNEPKIWTEEEIAALSMDEFDRLEAEIDQAVREGRVKQ